MWWLDHASAANQWADDLPLDAAAGCWLGQAAPIHEEQSSQSEPGSTSEEPTLLTPANPDTATEQIEQLQAQLRLLEEQLTTADVGRAADAQQHAEETATLQLQLADVQQSLAERSATATQLEAQLLEHQTVHAAQQQEWQAADAAASARSRELSDAAEAWRDRTSQLECDLDSQRHLAATLQSELASLRAQFDVARIEWCRQLHEEQQKLAACEASSRGLEQEWHEREATHVANATSAQARASAADEQVQSLAAQVQSLQECAVLLRADLENARREGANFAACLAELQAQWQDQLLEHEKLEARYRQEHSARLSAESESQRLLSELEQARQEAIQSGIELTALREQVEVERGDFVFVMNGLTAALRHNRRQIRDLEVALVRQVREVERRDEHLQALIVAGERSARRLAALQSQYESESVARQAAESASQNLATRMAGELDMAQARGCQLEAQVAQLRLERETQQSAFEQQIKVAEKKTEVAERKVQSLVQESNELRKSHIEIASRYSELISELRGETIQLTAKIIAAGEETQRLQLMLEQRERDVVAAQMLREQTETLATERLRTSEMLRGQVQTLSKGIQREAAARRKIEAALTRKLTEPDCPPQARELHEQLETQRQISQLTQQLAAQRNLEQLIRRQAAAEIRQLKDLLADSSKNAA